ncbi:fibroblast growth factor receptor 2 [Elysia marginata]|uniref:Fibroblast growth factor receptor 2 n=1 Tax=Elysia marginata TaxID=1093978 RepID=A0AAV4HCF6_9GAST|nr:fibroblast growth factor receptor 2 [Elysia marginata]
MRKGPLISVIDSAAEYRPYSLLSLSARQSQNQQLSNIPVVADHWEIPLSSLKFGPALGQGAFGKVVLGRVSRAMLYHRGVSQFLADGGVDSLKDGDKLHATVAIKMLQEGCDRKLCDDFLKEIQLMKRIGYHRNVVAMLACCTLREPMCLLVEHLPRGDLCNFMRKCRPRCTQTQNYVNEDDDSIKPLDLVRFALDIAKGMTFLSSNGFVHRDLAARNVLIARDKTCKIGDFGLARYIYDDAVYVNRKGGRLPVKWMSVEAIFDQSFSSASDVWSFGILLYELVTLGGVPYPTVHTRDLLRRLRAGYRMPRPDTCQDMT